MGFSGNEILTTSDPGGGASAWTAQYSNYGTAPECGKYGPPFYCPVPAAISTLVCKSANLCVALDVFGYVLSSTDPAGGPGAWHSRALDLQCYNGYCHDGVSCPSVSFCVASGDDSVFTSSSPGTGEWTTDSPTLPAGSSPPVLSPQSCPTSHLCVATNTSGDFLVSTSPAGSWTTSSIKHHDFTDLVYGYAIDLGVTSVACPSSTLCVAVDGLGNVIRGTRASAS